ncbi:hypothetical protein GA0115246_1052717 [Streptomyces sp. SolWspMP-sol7th]|uniref:hypothetical protein n=1 Tax=Streptomyces sp. SolWspMP-sol7th TaxID=1839776 RepID=UPI00081D8B84|nr:hypothetical protein [Streptomyces sp. SolWspMP-sol7th]SCD73219.1 hypothetical protein GA0115246_1052717 [Streptomyces sp. SolWspMP-sol7th]
MAEGIRSEAPHAAPAAPHPTTSPAAPPPAAPRTPAPGTPAGRAPAPRTSALRTAAHGIRDFHLGSDPGLGRLRSALVAGLAMAGALGIEYLYARLGGAAPQDMIVYMIIGTVVAMLGSNALAGPSPAANLRIAVFFPVALFAGLLPGIAVAEHEVPMLAGFVVVMFAAVYVRRFGLAYFFYGFMGWMGYFFAAFLHPRLSQLPGLLVAVLLATAWVTALCLALLRNRAGNALRHARAPPRWPHRLPPPRALRPGLPTVIGLRLFPHAGGTEEVALDQALGQTDGATRAAFVLATLDELPPEGVDDVLVRLGVEDPSGRP